MTTRYDNNIIYYFLTQRFGKFVSKELVEVYFNKLGIKNFNNLSSDEQIKAGEAVIRESFGEFYPEEKIAILKTLYLLNFSLENAGKKLNKIINKNCDLFINNTEEISITEIDNVLKPLTSDDRVCLAFEFTNSFEGALIISYEKEHALKLGGLITEDYTTQMSDAKEIENMQISGLGEMFNILLPSFSSVIEELFKTNIFYVPISYSQFKAKYYFNDKFIPIPIMMNSNINMKINNVKYKGNAMFFIKYATPEFENLMKQANILLDPFEKNPPRIVVVPSDNHIEDMEMLFKLLKLKREDMMDILTSLGKKDFNRFNSVEIDLFYNRTIERHLKVSSENKKQAIRINMQNIIPINM